MINLTGHVTYLFVAVLVEGLSCPTVFCGSVNSLSYLFVHPAFQNVGVMSR